MRKQYIHHYLLSITIVSFLVFINEDSFGDNMWLLMAVFDISTVLMVNFFNTGYLWIRKERPWYEVQGFFYDGEIVLSDEKKASYNAQFYEWTKDPGVMWCKCSDGQTRRIPSCQLIGFEPSHAPKQSMKNLDLHGTSCTS